MTEYRTTWYTQDAPVDKHQDVMCRQVYVWLITSDNKVAIVSKNGSKWQMPGGKPEANETIAQTAVRETYEETGLDISQLADQLRFFGYYIVEEVEDEQVVSVYMQVRYVLLLPDQAAHYTLRVDSEDSEQMQADVIRFADFVSPGELEARISWMSESEEYAALKGLLEL